MYSRHSFTSTFDDRNHLNEEEATKRSNSQMDSNDRAAHGDVILSSEFGLPSTKEQIQEAWKGVRQRSVLLPFTDKLAHRWFTLAEELQLEDPAGSKWWRMIRRHYSERQRYYHTLNHLDDMFRHFDEVSSSGDAVVDPIVVQLSIFFHDIIYDPRRGDNEAQSAILFETFASEVQLAQDVQKTVSEYILRTAKHHKAEGETTGDLALFLDIDLSVLGRDRAGYSKYAEEIRLEYQHVSTATFCQKRAQILATFLENKTIFFTEVRMTIHAQTVHISSVLCSYYLLPSRLC
jgi:predicted metal-dependent HD superfamily phosphohydrolase